MSKDACPLETAETIDVRVTRLEVALSTSRAESRGLRRRLGVTLGVAALGAFLIPLMADAVELPTGQPRLGDTIDAQAVWANFTALSDAIDANAARIAALEQPLLVRYSSPALDIDTTGGNPPVTVYFDGAEIDNSGGAVSTSLADGWSFIAPHSGRYLVEATLNWADCGAQVYWHGRTSLVIDGSVVAAGRAAIGVGTSGVSSSVSDVIDLAQDQIVTIEALTNCLVPGAEIEAGSYVLVAELGANAP